MKYLCLVYLEDGKFTAVPDRECQNCGDGLRKEGRLLAAEPLFPVRTAKTVRVRGGRISITDGPFAETKEQLAGFYLIDAATHDEALQIAATIPPAREGSIEVRPVRELQP
jgi:hypothetical protein